MARENSAASDGLHARRSLGDDQRKISRVPAQGVGQLDVLPNDAGSEKAVLVGHSMGGWVAPIFPRPTRRGRNG